MPLIVEEKSFMTNEKYDAFFEGFDTVETEKLTYYVEKDVVEPK